MAIRPYTETESTVDLRQYMAVLRRNRRLVGAVAGACILLAAIYSYVRTPIYTARAAISLQPILVDLSGFVDLEKQIHPETEREIVLSPAVATIAADELGVDRSPQELLKQVSVDFPQGSQILEISFSDPNPSAARRGALAFAHAYLSYRHDQAVRDVEDQVAAIDDELAQIGQDISDLQETIDSSKVGSITWSAAQADKQDFRDQERVLSGQSAALRGLNTNPGNLIGIPPVPTSPSSPKHAVDLALGLFFGLFLGVGLAFFRTRTDVRLHERLELEHVVGAPVLAVIPKDIEWTHRTAPRLVTIQHPRGPTAEAFRTLRPTLLVAAAQQNIKTIMVISPTASEGKTTTVANLGVVMAQADRRTMIVSADLRKPRVHEFFGLPNDQGLSDILLGKLPPVDAIRRSGVENLWVLPSGPIPERPAELLQAHAMKELLAEQRGLVDFILLDCPPVLAVADSLGLASMVDAVLFVGNAGSTTVDAAEQARERLRQVGATVIGCVLNDLDLSTSSSYYGYGYGDEAATPPLPNGKTGEVAPRRSQPSS